MKTVNKRTAGYDIDDVFLNRYSPRAMSGKSVSKEEVLTLLEAARWAPSASNIQPWRFLYTTFMSRDFDLFLSFLLEGNRIWCKDAGAFIIGLSKKTVDDGKANPWHSFDAGAAWENLALQGAKMGLVIHPMAGFDGKLIKEKLGIKDDYNIELMIAVGKPGKREHLPEYLQPREEPSGRKNLGDICFEGMEGAKKL